MIDFDTEREWNRQISQCSTEMNFILDQRSESRFGERVGRATAPRLCFRRTFHTTFFRHRVQCSRGRRPCDRETPELLQSDAEIYSHPPEKCHHFFLLSSRRTDTCCAPELNSIGLICGVLTQHSAIDRNRFRSKIDRSADSHF